MKHRPLAAPARDSELLRSFLAHFDIAIDHNAQEMERGGPGNRQVLCRVARAFSRLPYENLTKILKQAERADPTRARRLPPEVFADHAAHGTGGTCFSLTALLLHLTRALGFRAEALLADRHYGADTHCALVVWLDDRPHLLDPGFLINEPLPLDVAAPQRRSTPFNELALVPCSGGRLELYTIQQGAETHRLTFKTAPVDAGDFLRAWDASFGWDMMRYPLLTRVDRGRQLYLHGSRFQVRDHQAVSRAHVPSEDLASHIAAVFGVDPRVAARALALLEKRGEVLGRG